MYIAIYIITVIYIARVTIIKDRVLYNTYKNDFLLANYQAMNIQLIFIGMIVLVVTAV